MRVSEKHTVLMLFPRRDNNSLQQANRKLERKVKEMKMQTDEEHVNLQSQRDQVDQCLTAKLPSGPELQT